MYILFFVCVLCLFVATLLHFKSVEHIKLQRKYGRKGGVRVGKIYGTISGTMEFVFLVGLWISPQPRFTIPMFSDLTVSIFSLSIPIVHLVISLPVIAVGVWFGIGGARTTGMEVAETHCEPNNLETTGIYSTVRHPQYLGWILSHVGLSVLLSVWYSMLFTPILIALIYLISKKEEDELMKEFGEEYEDYQKRVPMLIPKLVK